MDDQPPQQKLQLPDHTRVQLVAVVQAIIAVAIAFGAPISDQQSVALLALAGVIGTVLIGADASIRRERARNADKLLPQVSVTETQRPTGSEVTTEIHAPIGVADGDDDVDLLVELLRRVLRTREPDLAAASAPSRKGQRRTSNGS